MYSKKSSQNPKYLKYTTCYILLLKQIFSEDLQGKVKLHQLALVLSFLIFIL